MNDTVEPTTETPVDPEVTTRRLKHLESIEGLNREARVAEADWLAKKETASDAKKLYESLMKRVSDLIAGGPATPLFDNAESDAADGDYRGWREIELDSLVEPALPKKILDNLAKNEPPIYIFGELADWQEKMGEMWAQAIPGIGEAAQAKIEAFQIAHLPSGDKAETAESDAAAEERAA